MVKAAKEILALGEVNAGLAAHGGVDLGEKCGGDLHVRNATHERRGQKAANVADNATAKGDEERSAIAAGLCHLARQLLDACECFVLFAGGKKKSDGRLGERPGECLAPEGPDLRRCDHKDAPGQTARDALDAWRKGGDQSAARDHVIFCRWCVYLSLIHAASIVKDESANSLRWKHMVMVAALSGQS